MTLPKVFGRLEGWKVGRFISCYELRPFLCPRIGNASNLPWAHFRPFLEHLGVQDLVIMSSWVILGSSWNYHPLLCLFFWFSLFSLPYDSNEHPAISTVEKWMKVLRNIDVLEMKWNKNQNLWSWKSSSFELIPMTMAFIFQTPRARSTA